MIAAALPSAGHKREQLGTIFNGPACSCHSHQAERKRLQSVLRVLLNRCAYCIARVGLMHASLGKKQLMCCMPVLLQGSGGGAKLQVSARAGHQPRGCAAVARGHCSRWACNGTHEVYHHRHKNVVLAAVLWHACVKLTSEHMHSCHFNAVETTFVWGPGQDEGFACMQGSDLAE